MKFHFLLLSLLFECIGAICYAQTNATVPTYHWAYAYLHELRLAGYLTSLQPIRQPYTEAELANSLALLHQQLEKGEMKVSTRDQKLIDLLSREFLVGSRKANDERPLTFRTGIWLDESIVHEGSETRYSTQLRSQVGVHWKDRLTCYNGIRLDQSLLDDPLYPGKRWRGFAGYTEQAYLRFQLFDRATSSYKLGCTIGRDFLNWGSGKTGRLLFSDHAQPFDQLSVNFQYKGLRFYMIAAQLEKWNLSDSLVKKYNTRRANRYLSAHGITISIRDKLFIGVTEALLYGGPDAPWELKYHNPMLYYHGELLNGGGTDGNGFLYLDVDYFPLRHWELYGEFLVDDYQLEKKIPIDLEPNEFGIIVGAQHGAVLGIPGSLIGLEYVRIANRTYNSWQEWEKFVHFNRPIGYALGNNFDRWHFSASQWLWPGWQIGVQWDRIRQGTGSVLSRWDTPWLKYTVAQGYHEPFPYGIVEVSSRLTLLFRYHPSSYALLEGRVGYSSIDNAEHQRGKSQQGWDATIKLHLDLGVGWRY